MTFLPVVERELRQRARWRSTYWIRGAIAFLATAVVSFVLMFMSVASAGPIGHGVLVTLGWLAFPFVVLEGLRNTADSLSVEKREGTLGLLFLTDLKGYDVVLGKFIASSLTSFYSLIAMIPALAVPVMLGGVTGGEFWRLVLALINALFFSLTAGTFVSAVSRSDRRAWTATFLLVLLFVVVCPTLGAVLKFNLLSQVSPFTPFWLFEDSRYTALPSRYWNAFWITHGISWCWLALASYLLPRLWQETGRRPIGRRRIEDPNKKLRRRNTLLILNPIWWLTARTHDRQLWLRIVVMITSTLGLLGFTMGFSERAVLWVVFVGAILLHLGLAIWVAFEACHSFADARNSGAMELLLCTPLTARQIIRGQHLALRELFMGPVIALLAVETFIAAGVVLFVQSGNPVIARLILILVLGFCLAWFVLDLFAVAEVGLWLGLTSSTPAQALTKTVLYVLILPLLLLVVPCCWGIGPGLMVAKSVIFFTWAQGKLEKEFRRAAAERYDSPRAPKWLGGAAKKLKLPGGL